MKKKDTTLKFNHYLYDITAFFCFLILSITTTKNFFPLMDDVYIT